MYSPSRRLTSPTDSRGTGGGLLGALPRRDREGYQASFNAYTSEPCQDKSILGLLSSLRPLRNPKHSRRMELAGPRSRVTIQIQRFPSSPLRLWLDGDISDAPSRHAHVLLLDYFCLDEPLQSQSHRSGCCWLKSHHDVGYHDACRPSW